MPDDKIDLSTISEEDLISVRISDLPIKIEGTWLEDCVSRLYAELDIKEIRFKPDCYLADEWLTPDGEPVIGMPFFLAHPALIKLENKMMLDVEGGTKEMCIKFLRHEAGHAMNYAYGLYRRKKWKQIFGRFSQEYADTYKFRPYSRSFVKHLEDYYAQYHPDEDFAETFAVWLTPEIDWQTLYKGWKAFRKLSYVDELMCEIKGKEPRKKGKKYWQASRLKVTLRNYYKRKRHFYAEDFPDFHDENLKRIFNENSKEDQHPPLAYTVIKKYRKDIIKSVSNWTGEKRYVTDELIKTLINRLKALGVSASENEQIAVLRISVYITALITNYVHTGKLRGKK